jgi:tripartite-type tricarboxylate transporter receptor subunit TctC
MFSTQGHWKAGRLKLIAHSGARRIDSMPELPTITESGIPGYEASIWYGFMAPAKTPRAVVQRLHREIVAIAKGPDAQQTFASQGNDVVANTPEEFAKVIKVEGAKWGETGRRLGVTLD